MRPELKAASAYFKSTDGHERAWKFSTRRLNLHLVDLIEDNDGVIIVDSTRRGKRMPDALSTTVPIWCAVLNRVLLPSSPLSALLFLPPHLPATTHAQVLALIPSFVDALRALGLGDRLPRRLSKPLRPLWVTPDSPGADVGGLQGGTLFRDYRPVVCCTASRAVRGSEMDEGGYVQGAADDAENWSLGLTPALFWAHVDELLATPEADLPDLIARILADRESTRIEETLDSSCPRQLSSLVSSVSLTPFLSVCPLPLGAPTSPASCHVVLLTTITPQEEWTRSKSHIDVGLGQGKTASRNLRVALPTICTFVQAFLQKHILDNARENVAGARVMIACDSGRDISIGTALALSCHLFDDEGCFCPSRNQPITKSLVKARLGGFMALFPEANPSRQTLQSVNSFLMDWRM
ncbi:hypothetical protein HIM_08751 [Hirsutella minnesotensis 3608]|uniref:Initiator tRNA phosphoribosyl transferase n=1 Tax=Hirsutella minnesotensis 3608 TaxID=1043627 RepID=A0A0F7ZH26_9HYPO|nr:hypothetical protein HIM_08751 [Hirsutella minnesotensis 3608]